MATLTRNSAELFQALLAIFQGGWQYVGLNNHLTAAEVGYILGDSGAAALIADAAFADVAREAAELAGVPASGRIAVAGDIPGFTPLADVLAAHPATRPHARPAGTVPPSPAGRTRRPGSSDPAVRPRDVRRRTANLTRYDIGPAATQQLWTAPMYHLSPLNFGYFSLHREHTVVLMEKWDAERALQLIEKYGVTDVAMVPTQLHRLMALPDDMRARYDVSSLRQVIHAAAPCPVELKQRLFAWLGPVIYEFYGASEGGGTLATPQDWLAHPGTVGRPWVGADVKVLDDDGHEVPAGTVGTVYLKLMGEFSYKGDPEQTAANRHGGYFTVGVMGDLDEDGFLYMRDRKIDMIVSGGMNIYPPRWRRHAVAPAVGTRRLRSRTTTGARR